MVTRNPIVPFPLDDMYEFLGGNTNPMVPDTKILCSRSSKKYCTSSKINSLLKDLFNITIKTRFFDSNATKRAKKMLVPHNARVVSIKMTGFVHGDECHSFIPVDGTVPGSYYTYQMFGANRIQMTCYVEGGVSYVAGFCIYFESTGLRDAEFPTKIIQKAFDSVQKYAGRRYEPVLNVQQSDETVELLPQQNHLGVVYCSRIGSNVISSVDQNAVSHQEIDEKTRVIQMKKCLECSGQTERNAPPDYSTRENINPNFE
uniref:PHR domain-containing protein n=1 Tax=Caenorhabditis tropicalis TaxID=1561998 RepID=A0A1I7UYI5_9PELO